MANATAVPFILKPGYISLVFNGKPYQLNKTHATFDELKEALENGQWGRVPKLLSLIDKIADEGHGAIQIRKSDKTSAIVYKGRTVDSSLTRRIVGLIREKQPVAYLLKFMDNLYRNPSKDAINELYDFLQRCNLPITDDGCFLAYKRVNRDYKDCHTGKIDNSVGQIVTMPRKAVDPVRRNHCSVGLHFCSRAYLGTFTGDRLMVVKINPKDVVSIPDDYGFTKGRTWRYEVVAEVPNDSANEATDTKMLQTSVVTLKKDRAELLKLVLKSPKVKRIIRAGKIKETTIIKWNATQVRNFAARFGIETEKATEAPKISPVLLNPMRGAREAAGLTIGQVAQQLKMTYKAVWAMENAANPSQQQIDDYLEAVARLSRLGEIRRSAVAYPKRSTSEAYTLNAQPAPAPAAVADEEEEDEYDEDYSEDEYEEDDED